MTGFHMDAPAELFVGSARGRNRRAMQYRRFDTGAEAIRYAIEDLPPELLRAAAIESGGERLEADEILQLYQDQIAPLTGGVVDGRHSS